MVNIAVTGLGYWGPNLVRNFGRVKGGSLKYVCDLNTDNIEKVKPMCPEAKRVTEFEKILEDDMLDAVAIATSAPTHAKLAKEALSSGKHVYVEKPLALSIKEAEEVISIARQENLVLMVGHLLLYHPAVTRLREIVESGDLGEIHYLYSQRLNLGRLRKDENVVWSLAPHDISMILYLKDAKPVEVYCTGGDYLRENIEDVAFINIRFNDGSMGHVHASWLDPHKIRKLTIVGSKKMAVFDDMESSEKIRIYDKGVSAAPETAPFGEELTLRFGDIVIPFLSMQEPLYLECQHFVDCIREDKKPLTDGENGLEVLKILEATDRSIKKGIPVKVK